MSTFNEHRHRAALKQVNAAKVLQNQQLCWLRSCRYSHALWFNALWWRARRRVEGFQAYEVLSAPHLTLQSPLHPLGTFRCLLLLLHSKSRLWHVRKLLVTFWYWRALWFNALWWRSRRAGLKDLKHMRCSQPLHLTLPPHTPTSTSSSHSLGNSSLSLTTTTLASNQAWGMWESYQWLFDIGVLFDLMHFDGELGAGLKDFKHQCALCLFTSHSHLYFILSLSSTPRCLSPPPLSLQIKLVACEKGVSDLGFGYSFPCVSGFLILLPLLHPLGYKISHHSLGSNQAWGLWESCHWLVVWLWFLLGSLVPLYLRLRLADQRLVLLVATRGPVMEWQVEV